MPEKTALSRSYHIELEPVGRRTEIQPGKSLLEAAQEAGVELVSLCGGEGICDSCRVWIVTGKLTPPTLEEQAYLSPAELKQGYRLACQAIPLGDVKIDIPPESLATPQRLQIEGQERPIELYPAVVGVDVKLSLPTITDLRSDVTRLKEAVAGLGWLSPRIEFPLLSDLSDRLRSLGWQARLALRNDEIITLLPHPESVVTDTTGSPKSALQTIEPQSPPPTSSLLTPYSLLGLAIDIGTTKLAGYLVDLADGRTLARVGEINPQISYGEDVISRIRYANDNPDGRITLQSRLVEALNGMVSSLCSQTGASPEQIVDAVVVGNTAMHHLFAGLPVKQLGASPYVPSVSEPLELQARRVGLSLASGAYVHLPPNIAGYVGADHVAMLLASSAAGETADRKLKTLIALDIGTNTEISLLHEGRILTCSCASGPAFEGAHIHDGMRAASGAIERVQFTQDEVRIFTIGGKAPVGICGSGILDAVAGLLEVGAIEQRGNFVKGHPLVQAEDSKREVVLVPAIKSGNGRDIVVNRRDVNEIQLAKGAIRAGIEVLLAQAGLISDQVDEFIVAGAFGTYLDLGSAMRVGMFPSLPMGRFRQVGNAAGAGARMMLLSTHLRHAAAALVERVEYIELTVHPEFTSTFIKAIMF